MTLRVFGPGSGRKILWLHGWMGNGGEGEGLQSQLGDNVQLICPDLPGHGERSLGETTLDDLLRDIAEMGKRCQAAAGYSMGGRLLMMAAARFPLVFTDLVIESAHPGLESLKDRMNRREVDAARAQDLSDRGFSEFCRDWYATDMWAGLNPTEKEGSHRDCAEALKRFGLSHQPNLRPWLRTTQTRILWLAGMKDTAYVNHTDWVRESTSHEVALLDTGHNLHAQCPHEWGQRVTSFLNITETSEEHT